MISRVKYYGHVAYVKEIISFVAISINFFECLKQRIKSEQDRMRNKLMEEISDGVPLKSFFNKTLNIEFKKKITYVTKN